MVVSSQQLNISIDIVIKQHTYDENMHKYFFISLLQEFNRIISSPDQKHYSSLQGGSLVTSFGKGCRFNPLTIILNTIYDYYKSNTNAYTDLLKILKLMIKENAFTFPLSCAPN